MSNTEETEEVAASEAGTSMKTARKCLRIRRLPSAVKKERHLAHTKGLLRGVWPEIREQLRTNPELEAKTVFAALQRKNPEHFADGQLRTFQRQVKHWRPTEGPSQEVYFAQEHHAGELCESDFTHMTDAGILIAGDWETGSVCFSESFTSLSEGLQAALQELGGVPSLHRTDRMTAAVNNLTDMADFQRSYQALMSHYAMEGPKIQTGQPNENGDIEQRHHRFKRALEQACCCAAAVTLTMSTSIRCFSSSCFCN